jgi:hypothetical protein
MYTPDSNDAVEINNVTRLLCTTLNALRDNGHLDKFSESTRKWLEEHDKLDEQRKGE